MPRDAERPAGQVAGRSLASTSGGEGGSHPMQRSRGSAGSRLPGDTGNRVSAVADGSSVVPLRLRTGSGAAWGRFRRRPAAGDDAGAQSSGRRTRWSVRSSPPQSIRLDSLSTGPGGEMGSRGGLKLRCPPRGRAGSNPAPGTDRTQAALGHRHDHSGLSGLHPFGAVEGRMGWTFGAEGGLRGWPARA